MSASVADRLFWRFSCCFRGLSYSLPYKPDKMGCAYNLCGGDPSKHELPSPRSIITRSIRLVLPLALLRPLAPLASAPRPPGRSLRPPGSRPHQRHAQRGYRRCCPRHQCGRRSAFWSSWGKSGSTRPGPLVSIPHDVVASHRLPRFLRAAAARRPTYLDFIRSCHTLQNALALASYASVCTFNCRCNSSTPVPRASRASTSTVLMA
jgi:hypothetical protein